MIGLIGVIITVGFGALILSLVYSPDYSKYSNVFFWIMVAGGIGYMTTLFWHRAHDIQTVQRNADAAYCYHIHVIVAIAGSGSKIWTFGSRMEHGGRGALQSYFESSTASIPCCGCYSGKGRLKLRISCGTKQAAVHVAIMLARA